MAILTVGVDQEFTTLSAAIAASQNGDVLQVQAGTYTNDFATISDSITIEGVGGMVNLVATEAPTNDKGILVVGTETSSPTVTLDNLEFSGAAITDGDGGNAAGVRYQAGNLTINDCYFHDNQDGLLADGDANGSVTITNSEFADNGTNSGFTHNIYINALGKFSITGSYVTAANNGNEIQSRALVSNITNNRIVDGASATASYSINLPNGGVDTVTGNTIEQGPYSQNYTIINYGGATAINGGTYANSSLLLSGNTILNDEPRVAARAIVNHTALPVSLAGNNVYGLTTAQIATGPVDAAGMTYLTTEPAISTAPPYVTLFPGTLSVLASDNYTLPAVAVTVTLGSQSNTVTAAAANLLHGDKIDGGSSGTNTLALTGGGTFNLATPATLVDFSTITVHEGSGTVLDLRAGLNATVNVSGSGGITIVGAANNDAINLGSGNATVTLGAGETVNGGSSGKNTIIVPAALLGATIKGGSGGGNTLEIIGSNSAVMGPGITGISRVALLQATNLTLNSIQGLTVCGTAVQVAGSTISNFRAGDAVDITNLADATAAFCKIAVGATSTVLMVTDGTNTARVTLNGAFGAGSFRLSNDGNGGTDIGFVPSAGAVYTLPAVPVTFALGSMSNTVTTTAADLVRGDNIDGGSGSGNTLALAGGGTFNLAKPATLKDFSTITVQGGTGTILDLRAGLNATVNVTGSAGIAIAGAANSDVINLGSGNATVTLGSGETVNGGAGSNSITVTASNETVNGGSGNDTIIVTAGLLSATINGGAGVNTLEIGNGGNAVMGSGICSISSVELLMPASLTLNNIADLRVFGTTAQVTGSTISNFLAGDTIDLTNLAGATAALTGIAVGPTSTVLTTTDGSNTARINLSGAFGAGSFQLGSDGSGGTDINFVPAAGGAYTLPAVPVVLALGAQANTVTATAADLVHGVSIDGGSGGSNTLVLSGGGIFNLAAPTAVTNFATITVAEGTGTVLDLRAALNTTVDVTGSAGITIVGATNSDVIYLGSGNDTVTLGAGETVNGGGGNNTIIVTAGLIGATINGGSGVNMLEIGGGGTEVMGSKIAGVSGIQLAAQTIFTANATANLQIAGSTHGGDTITLGAASQSVTSGGIDEHVVAAAANAGAQVSGLGAGSELEITTGGTVILNSATGGSAGDPLIVKLDGATNLTLSPMQFITAVGANNYRDTITAGATNQTLISGNASDTLIGYSGGHDIFEGNAASLNGDTIGSFLATDQIDITNLLPGAALLTATANGADTTLTVTSGATRASFFLAGSFTQSGFAISSDGDGGTFITHS